MGVGLANQLCVEMICVSCMLERLIDVTPAPCPYGILTGDVVQDVVAPFAWDRCDLKEQSPLSQPTLQMRSM